MKKGISVLIAGILMMSLTACQGDVGKKFSKQYRDLESYTATAVVTVAGNLGPMVYEMKQSYRAPDSYRIEVVKPDRLSGMITVVTGQDLRMKKGDTSAVSMELEGLEEETDFIFPITMLKEFFGQDSVPELEDTGRTMVLSAPVKKGNRYRMKQDLWMDTQTLLPTTMITYDEDGNEAVWVEFLDVAVNTNLEDELFSP